MESEINVQITIKHDENLPFNAQQAAGEIAKFIASHAGLSEGSLYIIESPRRLVCGPVAVVVRSAFISSTSPKMDSYEITPA